MTDRFKFRAWNKLIKKYISDIQDRDLVQGEGMMIDRFFDNYLYDNDFIIEQSTGLKDKNGTLIYEGDIVAVANGSVNGNVCISKWEVVWKEKEGRYNLPLWVSDKPDFSHYVKVLGNIHNNPELLEEK